jgi:Tfp pilus assembly protein PilE|nr:MAG TPA: Protein of unknown function (DUF1494) [Caudoviricetes sp.]
MNNKGFTLIELLSIIIIFMIIILTIISFVLGGIQ